MLVDPQHLRFHSRFSQLNEEKKISDSTIGCLQGVPGDGHPWFIVGTEAFVSSCADVVERLSRGLVNS